MNRFVVLPDRIADFEQRWRGRAAPIRNSPGFVLFSLLRGPEQAEGVLYVSHTQWRDKRDFEAWTRSEAFRDAHRDAGTAMKMTAGSPVFEGFESVLETRVD